MSIASLPAVPAPRFPAAPVRAAFALAATLALAGCGSLWPFGSSKSKIPEPPAVTASVGARVAWSTRLGPAGIGFAPAVSGGNVFAASSDGEVARLSADNGALSWRVNVGKRLSAGVGADGNILAVATRDGSLLALDAAGGKQRWSVPVGADVVTVPAISTGLVVIRSSDNRISAFDAETGRRRWTFQRQSPPLVLRQTSGLTIAADTVFAGLPGGRLVALNLQTGALRWEAAVSQPKGATEIERIADVAGSPVLGGRDVCAVTFQGKVSCFEVATGRISWSRDVSSASGLAADARLLAVPDDRGQVHAFSRSGASQWRQEKLAGRALSAPLVLGDAVIVGDQQGLLHLLARDDGAIAGRFSTDGSAIVSAPVAVGNVGVVQTRAGAIVGIAVQ